VKEIILTIEKVFQEDIFKLGSPALEGLRKG
jgi:hypothetical protein